MWVCVQTIKGLWHAATLIHCQSLGLPCVWTGSLTVANHIPPHVYWQEAPWPLMCNLNIGQLFLSLHYECTFICTYVCMCVHTCFYSPFCLEWSEMVQDCSPFSCNLLMSASGPGGVVRCGLSVCMSCVWCVTSCVLTFYGRWYMLWVLCAQYGVWCHFWWGPVASTYLSKVVWENKSLFPWFGVVVSFVILKVWTH